MPSAKWLRHEFPVHRIRTKGFSCILLWHCLIDVLGNASGVTIITLSLQIYTDVLTAGAKALDLRIYFYYCRDIEELQRLVLKKQNLEQIIRYADMFSAMGTESRLRIMQLLLSAHPDGLIVGEIGHELEIPSSTLSHHLEKLKNEDLVKVRREGTFLWYSANTEVLQELLGFLYAECCTRNKAIEPRKIVSICR